MTMAAVRPSPALRLGLENWLSWAPSRALPWQGPAAQGPEPAVPALLRRRLTPIGRQALSAALRLGAGRGGKMLLSSRHGEFARTALLMESVTQEGSVSPAEFSLSVHNAIVGLASMASGNRAGHGAMAAGRDSLGYALVEAATSLLETPDEPIVLLHYDEPVPEIFATTLPADEPALLIGLRLVAPDGADERIVLTRTGDRTLEAERDGWARPFADFLESGAPSGQAIGDRTLWQWRCDAA